MKDTNQTAQDCGCNDPGCCQSKRKPRWIRIISLIVILAAVSIVVIKIVNRSTPMADINTATAAGKACSSDTTKSNGCDTTKNSSCCPESGN